MNKRRKMWLWILLGSPIALIAIAALIGIMLPENYAATARITTSLTPAEVWLRLNDPETYPMSGKMLKGLELLPNEDGRAVWIEDLGLSKLRIRNLESREPEHLVRLLEDTVVPFRSRCEFTIESSGTGSVVTCVNQCTVSSGTWHVPFFRITMCLCGGAKSGPKDYLTRLSGGDGSLEWLP